MADFEGGNNAAGDGVEHGEGAVLLRGNEDALAVRAYLHPFRLSAHLDGLVHLARGDVDDAHGGDVFIRDVELLAVFADIEVFRVGAAGNHADNLVLRHIEYADSIRALVRRGQRALVHIGTGNRRSAQRDVEGFAVGAGMDAARALAKRNGGDDLEGGGIYDREIARHLVGDIDARSRGMERGLVRGRGGGCGLGGAATRQGYAETGCEQHTEPLIHGSPLLEGNVFLRVLMRSNGDSLLLRAETLLPDSDGIDAGRQVGDGKAAILLRHRKVGIVNHADVGVHPAMDVALDANHHFRLDESSFQGRIAGALAVVPLAVDLGHGMDVVRDRVRIDHLQLLVHLDAEDAGIEPAALLVNGDRRGGSFKALPFQALLHIDKGVGQPAIGCNHKRFVHGLPVVGFHAGGVFAHVDLLCRVTPAGVADHAGDGAGGGGVDLKRGRQRGLRRGFGFLRARRAARHHQ